MVKTEGKNDDVQKQLEFYFSDSNLPRDRFLRSKVEENEDGYVDISVILTFNRIKQLGATVSSVAAAVEPSKLLQIDESGMRIRRVTPLPEKSLFETRAVYVKGWKPQSVPPSIEEVRELFAPFGDVLNVIKRYWKDDTSRTFRGSVFVEMDSPEAAERVLADEFKITVEEDGKPVEKKLQIELVPDYRERKREEIRLRSSSRGSKGKKKNAKGGDPTSNKISQSGVTNDDGATAASTPGREFVEVKEVVVTKEEEPPENGVGVVANEAKTEASGNEVKVEVTESKVEFEAGLILRFEGVSTETTREDIREVLENYGDVTFVDFSRGMTDGHVRFRNASGSRQAYDELTKSPKEFGGKVPTLRVLDGDDEVEYWREIKSNREMQRKRTREFSQRGGRPRKRGRRGGGRHRGFRNNSHT